MTMNLHRVLQVTRKIGVNQICSNYCTYSYSNTIRRLVNQNVVNKLNAQTRCISTLDGRTLAKEESLLSRIISKLPIINVRNNKLDAAAYILYESVADGINYVKYFEEFDLPDTFYSWFVITELYIWMLMVRCMAEGEDGRRVRNKIVQALWSDVQLRAKKVGELHSSGIRVHISELSEQFQAALIAYDEGLQTEDTTLAAAIWRRMYQQRAVDPEHLEHLVRHIRRQIRSLDSVPKDELFSLKLIKFESPDSKK